LDVPLISCICITRNRADLLNRAIDCFRAQTYTNKELLVLYEDDDLNTKNCLNSISSPEIKIIEVPSASKLSLGKLRNLSIKSCGGDFFCQWDDDDWYHQNRLKFQMDVIKKSQFPACILMYWIVFDSTESKAYLSPFWAWEGSLLCKKKLIMHNLQYADKKKKEDTPLIRKLLKQHCVFPVLMPKLYIYVYHSKNTWDYDHWHNNIITKGKPLSDSTSELIGGILDGHFSVEEGSKLLDRITN